MSMMRIDLYKKMDDVSSTYGMYYYLVEFVK